jgi:mannose-6-phosphate isomerase-like protein (cupin superfamily)
MAFFRWLDFMKDVEPGSTLPAGMSRRAVVIDGMMLALHEAFPNLKCKPHCHESSQITYMLQGRLRMCIGDEEQVIAPGEFAYMPSNVKHSIESLDEFVVALDVFTPARPDIVERLQALAAQHELVLS